MEIGDRAVKGSAKGNQKFYKMKILNEYCFTCNGNWGPGFKMTSKKIFRCHIFPVMCVDMLSKG